MEAYKPSKADYFWNMSGCLASAMASLLLVIGVTRIMGTEAGGIFSLAFSLGQLLMMLGNMGLRTYQVSDLEERYSMGEYVVNRIISCALHDVMYMCVWHSDPLQRRKVCGTFADCRNEDDRRVCGCL